MNNDIPDPTEKSISAESLVSKYRLKLSGYLTRHLRRNWWEVNDVIQETYIRLHRIDFHTIENPKSYLFTVARNVVAEHASKKKSVESELMYDLDLDKEVESPTTGVDEIEHMSSLTVLLRSLTTTQRKVLIMAKVQGKSHDEIAKELGVAEDTVTKHIYMAVVRCRKIGWK
ncbi:MAG: sigma-70 family RNA polymerase sigma factor [Exilibacterium sp.]